MTEYRIELKPIEPYYFSGENSVDSNNNKVLKYLMKSRELPQQTTLLGMLRKELLKAKGHYKDDYADFLEYYSDNKVEIDKLIGSCNFNGKLSDLQSFGVIKKLSPIIICDDEKNYFIPAPKNYYRVENTNKFKVYELEELGEEKGCSRMGKLYNLKNYDPKVGLTKDYIQISYDSAINTFKNTGELIKKDSIFETVERVGITKGKDGKTQDEAYYKRKSYFLKENRSFVFFADLELDNFERESFVNLGGNQSMFKLKITKTESDNSFQKIVKPLTSENYLTVIGEAYLDIESILNDEETMKFGIIETIDFRTIKIEKGTSNKKIKFSKQEEKLKLIDRGSILYTNNKLKLGSVIDSYKNLKQLGYNYYI